MKLLGAALLLGSAGAWSFLRRLEGQLLLRLGRALLEDLAVFRYHVRVCRTPLPELLEEVLDGGPGADRLWRPLGAILGEKGGDLPRCWRMAVRPLPPPMLRTTTASTNTPITKHSSTPATIASQGLQPRSRTINPAIYAPMVEVMAWEKLATLVVL